MEVILHIDGREWHYTIANFSSCDELQLSLSFGLQEVKELYHEVVASVSSTVFIGMW